MLERVAYFQGRKDDAPNIEVADELVQSGNRKGVKSIAAGLHHENRLVTGDAVKVLYEIGYRKPELIAPYAAEFITLLSSRVNRLVWGGMIALGTIAHLVPELIWENLDVVKKAYQTGGVIAVDHAVTVFAKISRAAPRFEKTVFPLLLEHLAACRPKEVPQHAERAAEAVTAKNAAAFRNVLEKRRRDLTERQQKRLDAVLKKISA
ncbi:MAG TPA: hypothetical protein ENN69_06600 [Spirochaetia bacterium]|nr:hypothetical protein [Spirochaetia bacterium]